MNKRMICPARKGGKTCSYVPHKEYGVYRCVDCDALWVSGRRNTGFK